MNAMQDNALVAARMQAERAVQDMKEGPLKIAAFQTILAKLLTESESGGQPHLPNKETPVRPEPPDTTTGRILAIKAEGFFASQRSLSEVREALGSRGWHYPLTTLSGAMQALVRQRHLRRERVNVGRKNVWLYSNP